MVVKKVDRKKKRFEIKDSVCARYRKMNLQLVNVAQNVHIKNNSFYSIYSTIFFNVSFVSCILLLAFQTSPVLPLPISSLPKGS